MPYSLITFIRYSVATQGYSHFFSSHIILSLLNFLTYSQDQTGFYRKFSIYHQHLPFQNFYSVPHTIKWSFSYFCVILRLPWYETAFWSPSASSPPGFLGLSSHWADGIESIVTIFPSGCTRSIFPLTWSPLTRFRRYFSCQRTKNNTCSIYF